MTEQIEYVRAEDREEYQRFLTHHWKSVGAKLPKTVWHYTDAEGLIGILKTGKIYATHISCLNDNLEQKYFGDLVLAEVISGARSKGKRYRLKLRNGSDDIHPMHLHRHSFELVEVGASRRGRDQGRGNDGRLHERALSIYDIIALRCHW